MGKISLARMNRALEHLTEDELYQHREAVNQQLARYDPDRFSNPIENQIVDRANVITIKYFEQLYQPYMDARWTLKYLIDVMDTLASFLWDEALSKALNGEFEKELSGTWYRLNSTSARPSAG